ncbi:MAG: DNA gyrase inhibitor YacG [Phycisphaeraceae bacterium]
MSESNGNNGNHHNDRQKQQPCPICGNPVAPSAKTFPFCSPRCRKIDLGKWLKEEYTISRPIERSDLEEGE